jgi:hypothetical protein
MALRPSFVLDPRDRRDGAIEAKEFQNALKCRKFSENTAHVHEWEEAGPPG